MTQNKYVTSTCIDNISRYVTNDAVPIFKDFKKRVSHDAEIPFPGCGAIGLPFSWMYESAQGDVIRFIEDSVETLTAWADILQTIKKNWREAEEASKVKYV